MTGATKNKDHNRLIAMAAKEGLGNLGLVRKGKSRTWYADHGWWLGLVEFQPSSWSRGTYLNVGVTWLWSVKGYFSFDEGGRLAPFAAAGNELLFSQEIKKMIDLATTEIASFEQRFHSLQATSNYFSKKKKLGPWEYFHAGICMGLVGNVDASKSEFEKVLSERQQAPWVDGLKTKAIALSKALEQGNFRDLIKEDIATARRQLALTPMTNVLGI